MSFSKTKAYNHALSALLLSKQVVNPDTENSNEVRVLNQFWDDALTIVLQELDSDTLSETIKLELVAELDINEYQWQYAYKYPSRCASLSRVVSCYRSDTEETSIDKMVKLYNGEKVIFTDQPQARIECIPTDISLAALSPHAGLAVSYYLAYLAAPLATGKGAEKLTQKIYQRYEMALNSAREFDARENHNSLSPIQRSSFVAARMSGY